MTHVVTLVCNPRAPVLTEAVARRAMAVLPRPGPPVWLDPGIAADIAFAPGAGDDAPLRTLADAVREALDGAEVDVFAQKTRDRRKKLLAADMDSTMIGQECIDELAGEAGERGCVAAITARAMRGEVAFEPALRARTALLRGLHRSVIARIIDTTITLTPGARALVRTMRRHGARTVLVSGGFTAFTTVIGAMIGFDEDYANALEFDADGRLTGGLVEPVLAQEAKRETLRRLRAECGLTVAQTLAVGDGANDLAMLREAGLGVSFYGKPAVAAAAHARIEHADLTALLYAQGFARGDFIDDEAGGQPDERGRSERAQ